MLHTGSTLKIAAVLLIALFVSSAATAAKPPAGRTYFVVSIGVASDASEAYEEGFGCLEFTRTEVCSGDDCGSWSRLDTDKDKGQGSFVFEFELTDDGTGELIEVTGQAEIDGRGRKSAIGGTAIGLAPESGRKINMALSGRAVRAARCPQLVEERQNGS